MHVLKLLAVAVVAGALLILVVIALQRDEPAEPDIDSARESAVALARDGQYEEALRRLERLHATAPDHAALLWDRIVILTWAGDYEQALALAAELDPDTTPDWVTRAVDNAIAAVQREPAAEPPVAEEADSAERHRVEEPPPAPAGEPAPPAAPDPPPRRAWAVADPVQAWLDAELARYREDGDLARTLERLSDKLAQHPSHLRLRADLAVLQVEAGQYESALATAAVRRWRVYPAYALIALGTAARHTGDTDSARDIYAAGRAVYPGDDRLLAGWIMALADRDDTLAQARREWDQSDAARRSTLSMREARAYLHTREGHYAAAARDFRELAERDPASAFYRRQQVFALQRAEQSELALETARRQDAELTPAEWAALLADVAAFHVRMAGVQKYQADNQHWHRRAHDSLDAACAAAADAGETAVVTRCHADRILLLTEFEQDVEAIELYEARLLAGAEIPPYAHYVMGGAYLRHDRVQPATAALQRAGELVTALDEAILLLVQERHREAERLLEREIAQQPRWIWGRDSEQHRENPVLLSLEQARINSIAYSNQLRRALAVSEARVEAAPGNSWLRLQRAQLYRWHGWPRRAEHDYNLLERLDADSLPLRAARIGADLEDGEYRAAVQRLDAWRQDQPLQTTRYRMDERIRTALGPYMYGRVDAGRSEGGNTALASRELSHELTYYSRAHAARNDTRLFATQRGRYASFETVRGTISRQGIGVFHRQRNWQGQAMISNRVGGPAGLSLSGRIDFDDHWQIDGRVQSDSESLPIRAAKADIDARSRELGLGYRFHARREFRVAVEAVNLSDDNRRRSVLVTGRQPLYHRLPHGLDLRQSLYATRNSRSDTPYFSPERMASATLHLDYEGRLFALFERRWVHRLSVGAGASQQRGFGTDPVADLSYEHRYRRDRHLEWALGVSVTRRTFDGNDETGANVFSEFLWRFH